MNSNFAGGEGASTRERHRNARLIPRLIASALLLFPLILIPYLELNVTHLLNPEWPAHARMHEAWQLITNAGVASLALGWTWTRDGLARGSALGTLITAGFVVAWLVRDFYQTYDLSPANRPLVKAVKQKLGEEKGNSIYLLTLFPESPAKLASKIAGLPKPANCF